MRRSDPPRRNALLFLFFTQNIPHVTEGLALVRVIVLAQLSCWPVLKCPRMAGFQVSTEAAAAVSLLGQFTLTVR
jgi:hypothetical protein